MQKLTIVLFCIFQWLKISADSDQEYEAQADFEASGQKEPWTASWATPPPKVEQTTEAFR